MDKKLNTSFWENIFNILDFYHQNRIINFLRPLRIYQVIDVGSHKGEFLSYILKLKNMEQVLLPTHSLKISKSGKYLETPGFCGVSQFSGRYSMVGGINAPKKISCIGSNGKVRPQLLKGKDDLR